MAYDRYDTRDTPRDERSRWPQDRYSGRYTDRDWRGERGRGDERGFFERAGDEVASWFGDEDAERRRREDERMRGRDTNDGWQREPWGSVDRDRGYRPMTGDYGRSERFLAASGGGSGERGLRDYERSQTPLSRDEYRRSSYVGPPERTREFDPHYRSWRQRQIEDLDRDYDEYRRENQMRFEDDFGSWRERRQHQRGLLDQIREHMEVVGADDDHVGTIDRVAGDRIILTKSDPESGGVHHSLSCADIARVEGDRVILGLKAEDARQRWRDESRGRALFEREDQGEMGPRSLGRSFEGTYR